MPNPAACLGDVPRLDSGASVLRRPHFNQEGDVLFFMLSRRPSRALAGIEPEVWETIGQTPTLGALRERFLGRADMVIQEFWLGGVFKLAESTFPAARRQALVIEPHADDAALSIAGVIWLQRHVCAFTIATLPSRSKFLSYFKRRRDFVEVERVKRLRRARRNQAGWQMRVLLLVPTGRWVGDLALLCAAFPQARFEVHAAPAAFPEVANAESERVVVRAAGAGSLAWGLLSLRLCAATPMPTLFYAGTRRLGVATGLSKLWVLSDTLVASAMDPVMHGLTRGRPPARADHIEASS